MRKSTTPISWQLVTELFLLFVLCGCTSAGKTGFVDFTQETHEATNTGNVVDPAAALDPDGMNSTELLASAGSASTAVWTASGAPKKTAHNAAIEVDYAIVQNDLNASMDVPAWFCSYSNSKLPQPGSFACMPMQELERCHRPRCAFLFPMDKTCRR